MEINSKQTHSWKVPKTVHVHELGLNSQNAELQWLVFHGYAQSPNQLIKAFQPLFEKDNVILPEATSRFYRKGYEGEVVNSWMTSRFRDDEIKDQQAYLNSVYEKLIVDQQCPTVILAFSQGAATALRWLEKNKPELSVCAIYAGWPPDDVNYDQSYWQELKHYYLLGDNDYFIHGERIKELKTKEYIQRLMPEWIDFKGPHEVLGQVLKTLRSRIIGSLLKM